MTRTATALHFQILIATACVLIAAMLQPASANPIGPTAGGDGGIPFDSSCPNGAVLTGVDVWYSAGIGGLAPLCKQLTNGRVQQNLWIGPRIGGTARNKARLACYDGTFVQRMKVQNAVTGRFAVNSVTGVEIFCDDGRGGNPNFWYQTTPAQNIQSTDLSCSIVAGGPHNVTGLRGEADDVIVQRLGPLCTRVASVDQSRRDANAGRFLVYAADGRGRMGFANGWGTKVEAENVAMNGCGGRSSGCSIVMSEAGNCMAYSESNTPAGYWFYVALAGDQGAARNFAQKFCDDGPAPRGSCTVRHSVCN